MSVESGRLPASGVETMFDRIAPVYDVMNRVMTAGLDGRWRRLTAEAVVRPGDRVLDACCGTGDLALACLAAGAGSVVGLDFAERMLERARQAGAVVLFAAPGFYHGAETGDDLVDFVVGRCLDQLGVDHALVPRWGQP